MEPIKSFVLYCSEVKTSNIMYHTSAITTQGLYIFYTIFTMIYIVECLVLRTIYVLNKEIIKFLGLKYPIYDQDWFQIKSGLEWSTYGK